MTMRGISSPGSVEEHIQDTRAWLDSIGATHAVLSGSMEILERYTAADPRFIPGYQDGPELIPVEEFEAAIQSGKIRIFGEVVGIYQGRSLNHPLYAPYLELCEKYGIPVAYHTGGGPPMTQYRCCPDFRISLGDPFLIEDVLVRYPNLKIYLMHSGEVYFEKALRLMLMYPKVHSDLGVLLWVDESTMDYGEQFLRKAKKYGLLDRVMFGSDQMMWPAAIGRSVETLQSMDFLTEEDRRLILYENARRFLELP